MLGDVLAEHVLELRGRARTCLAVEVAGGSFVCLFGSGRTAVGMPSGKVGHHPGWKPLQGSADDHVPGWALLGPSWGSPLPTQPLTMLVRPVFGPARAAPL